MKAGSPGRMDAVHILGKHISLAHPSSSLRQEILDLYIIELMPIKLEPDEPDMQLMLPELLQNIKESVSILSLDSCANSCYPLLVLMT